MKLAMIGFGQAGGKIVDKFLEYDQRTNSGIVRSAVAVNTAKADLLGLEQIPEEHWGPLSDRPGSRVTASVPTTRTRCEIAEEGHRRIQGAIDNIPVHEIDAFLVVSGLGGGTGSGGSPVISKHLKRIYTGPVYGLGVLPGATRVASTPSTPRARSRRSSARWTTSSCSTTTPGGRLVNPSRAGTTTSTRRSSGASACCSARGEVGAGDNVAESVVDSSEIINTLAGGGVSTVGYASEDVELGVQWRPPLPVQRATRAAATWTRANTTNRITSLVRKAALGRLTLPCEIEGAERALLVMAGPSQHLNRKGIERGRKWLEEQTGSMEVRGGDYLTNEPRVAAAVLLSGIHNVPRIKELQQIAIEAQGQHRRHPPAERGQPRTVGRR